eukprot:7472144-Lingulodinium_polyedra.AAC.1
MLSATQFCRAASLGRPRGPPPRSLVRPGYSFCRCRRRRRGLRARLWDQQEGAVQRGGARRGLHDTPSSPSRWPV